MGLKNGWIGVDLDGTLAEYYGWNPDKPFQIGKPIPKMVKRVQNWLRQGKKVKIFTARVDGGVSADEYPGSHEHYKDPAKVRKVIEDWCEKHIGQRLEVTNVKDAMMIELWDDRARQVVLNKGDLVTSKVTKVSFHAGVVAASRCMKSSRRITVK